MGNVPPASEKPVPAMVPELIVTGIVPEAVSETDWVAAVFKLTLPKAMLVEEALRFDVAAFNCNPKVFDAPPPVAVKVAD
jgi:hypothetical protein